MTNEEIIEKFREKFCFLGGGRRYLDVDLFPGNLESWLIEVLNKVREEERQKIMRESISSEEGAKVWGMQQERERIVKMVEGMKPPSRTKLNRVKKQDVFRQALAEIISKI